MVDNPEFYIENFKDIGIHNFTFQWEATAHHDTLITQARKYYKSIGISLNPSTDHTVIPKYILKEIDLILIMSVNPGFGTQSLIPGVIDKIKYFKKIKDTIHNSLEIQVDGGVNNKNSCYLIQAGATNLVAGSYIFTEQNKNYNERINLLR